MPAHPSPARLSISALPITCLPHARAGGRASEQTDPFHLDSASLLAQGLRRGEAGERPEGPEGRPPSPLCTLIPGPDLRSLRYPGH